MDFNSRLATLDTIISKYNLPQSHVIPEIQCEAAVANRFEAIQQNEFVVQSEESKDDQKGLIISIFVRGAISKTQYKIWFDNITKNDCKVHLENKYLINSTHILLSENITKQEVGRFLIIL